MSSANKIKKLHFDCAQASGPHNFGALKSFMPLSHIMFGSDHPFVHVADALDPLMAVPVAKWRRAGRA